MQKNSVILGINYGLNDSGAALLVGNRLVAAAEEERFNREKHTRKFPKGSIDYCLREAGLSIEDITDVAYYWNTQGRFFDRVKLHGTQVLRRLPRPDKLFSYIRGLYRGREFYDVGDMLFPKKTLTRHYPSHAHNYDLVTLNHHHTHAACAYYHSGFENAAVLVVDGSGEIESISLYEGKGGKLRLVDANFLPDSLGVFYGALTEFLGFKKFDSEYKVMGLAAYGEPKYLEEMRSILRYKSGLRVSLWDYAFAFQYGSQTWFGQGFEKLFGPARKDGDPLTQREKDIAASGQKLLEEILIEISRYSMKKIGTDYLCMAGGVALNCSANGKIHDTLKPKGFFVHPASHDGGTAVGAALWLANEKYGVSKFAGALPYLGPEFSDQEIEAVLQKYKGKFSVSRPENLEKEGAAKLAQGLVGCRFSGRMELGPRALGNRSIIADPKNVSIRDEINVKVKLREEFRPFAPSCLEEDFDRYFEGIKDPYMVFTQRVTPRAETDLPAIVHTDRTARVQVVTENMNPGYYRLIKEFKKLSGYGVILNTSFNIQEPIVCSPEDAMNTFNQSTIDFMLIGPYLVSR